MIKIRRTLALILLPFVSFGLFLVIKNAQLSRSAYAVDPLVVTYAGGPPPNPMFVVTDMLPGDEVEKVFNVKNDSPDPQNVIMDGIKTEEVGDFAGILEVLITDEVPNTYFSGTLQDFFDSPPISLGTFPSGSDKNFRVKVKFPSGAGNEYQNAKVVFDIIWKSESAPPPIELPEECRHLAGIITTVIEGTEGDDFILGERASELILAKGGRDYVLASKGDDCIVGGEGNDYLLDGSDGNDVIIGGPGNDRIDGSDDKDIIYGNGGGDSIEGGNNEDLIYGGEGNDVIDSGGHDDKVYGEGGDDNIQGGSENDEIYGGVGADNIEGESGNDKLYGNEGDDNLDGGSGLDFLNGGPDTDTLNGGSNTDTCINGEIVSSCEP